MCPTIHNVNVLLKRSLTIKPKLRNVAVDGHPYMHWPLTREYSLRQSQWISRCISGWIASEYQTNYFLICKFPNTGHDLGIMLSNQYSIVRYSLLAKFVDEVKYSKSFKDGVTHSS